MRAKKLVTRLAGATSGAVGVEFAMISVVLIMALMGVVEIGRAVWVVQTLERAAQNAARYAYTGVTDAEIEARVDEALIDLDPSVVTKSVTPETVDGIAYKTIRVSYAFEPLVPMVPIEATIARSARVPQ